MIDSCPAPPRRPTPSTPIAEPRRRDILDYLGARERPVGDIVVALGLAQPSVSKHLRVLRDVGLVDVRRDGRQMLYRTNAEAIRPLHEWTGRSSATGGRSSRASRNAPSATKRRHERMTRRRHHDRRLLQPSRT